MGLTQKVHDGLVHGRRVRVLADHLVELIPAGSSVLDIGCGDGLLASLIQRRRPDITLTGIDVLMREGTHVPVAHFDGTTIPLAEDGVDVVTFVDVLHHIEDPMVMLREAARVARRAVIIKDHTRDGLLAGPKLRFMDYVGNAHDGVALPYNYWPGERWRAAFRELGLSVEEYRDSLHLYPGPADWIFGASLHFIARLAPSGAPADHAARAVTA